MSAEPLVLTTQGVERWQIASADGRYRYRLFRRWADGDVLPVLGVNPSTADGTSDDPTSRLWMDIAKRMGFGAIDVGNPYALRSSSPDLLARHPNPIGPDNERHLREIIRSARPGAPVLCSWGDACPDDRAEYLLGLIDEARAVPFAVGLTQSGRPAHVLGWVRRLTGDARAVLVARRLVDLQLERRFADG